jgi:outer membrane lipoprotein LolB
MNWSKRVVVAAALAVAACAAVSPPIPQYPAPFDLTGRMLVNHDGRAFSSGVRWRHAPGRDEIWLLTPVGQALAHIVSDVEGATFTGADRRQFQAASVEDLTRQALGWELPVTRLQYWARGEIAPGSAPELVERDAAQRLVRLGQDGWRIAYANYPENEHGGLPRRLELIRGTHEIRFVIDGWRAASGAQ